MRLKAYAKQIPLVLPVYRAIMGKQSRAPQKYAFQREDCPESASPAQVQRSRILNILNYTKTSGSSYSAHKFPAGYHEIKIGDEVFAGQRSPDGRLKHLSVDFSGKTLLDIGCNQGGMVFALHEKLKWAVGLDYDYRMINACNLIAREKQINNS